MPKSPNCQRTSIYKTRVSHTIPLHPLPQPISLPARHPSFLSPSNSRSPCSPAGAPATSLLCSFPCQAPPQAAGHIWVAASAPAAADIGAPLLCSAGKCAQQVGAASAVGARPGSAGPRRALAEGVGGSEPWTADAVVGTGQRRQ